MAHPGCAIAHRMRECILDGARHVCGAICSGATPRVTLFDSVPLAIIDNPALPI
jgi:hypothetical protein